MEDSTTITIVTETNGNAFPSSSLPPEILVNVFSFLSDSVTDLLSCAQVNQAWHHVVTAFYIWYEAKFKKFETFSRFHEVLQSIAKARSQRALGNWDRLVSAYLDAGLSSSASGTLEEVADEQDENVIAPISHSTRFYGHFVIKLNLSEVQKKKHITEQMFCDLFPNLPNLENVNFRDCYTVTDEVIKKLTESCRHLKKIKLYGCTQLTNKSLNHIGTRCPEITLLNIGFCTYITSIELQSFLGRCKKLTSITISYCSNAPANSLVPVVGNLQGLQKLYTYRGHASDLIVKSIIPHLPRLRKLDLGISKPKLSDEAAEIIAQHCPNLVHLSLSFSSITNKGLKSIGQGCRSLSFIDLSGCNNIGNGIHEVLSYFPELKVVKLQSLLQVSGKSFSAVIKSSIEHVTFFNSKIFEETSYDLPTSEEEKSCSKLKKLILEYCEISDKNLRQIAHWCKNLEVLDISLVYEINDEILQFLCSNLDNLKEVVAKGCYRISVAKQNELKDHQRIKFTF